MATCNGILGLVSGNVGGLTFSIRKGKQVVGMRRRKINAPPSQKQKQHRAKFTLVTKFIGSLSSLWATTFKDSRTMTAMNVAFRYNYDRVLVVADIGYTLDYANIVVSQGPLSVPESASAEVKDNNVIISWMDDRELDTADPSDKSILVLHCPEMKRSIYNLGGAPRSSGRDFINAEIFSGKTVETWLAFIDERGKQVSWSRYAGQVLIP